MYKQSRESMIWEISRHMWEMGEPFDESKFADWSDEQVYQALYQAREDRFEWANSD